ncbi:MAG: LptF/LptG family permease [bacterium]
MKILTRYILREFLKMFILCNFAVAFLFLLVNIFNDMDDLVERGVGFGIAVVYFLLKLPRNLGLVIPIATMLSALIIFSGMSRHNETVAMKAGTISYFQMTSPVIFMSILISFLSIAYNETVVPWSQIKFKEVDQIYVSRRAKSADEVSVNTYGVQRKLARYTQRDNRLYYINVMDGDRAEMKDVMVLELGDDNTAKRRIDAQLARWLKGRWHFYDGALREFDGRGEVVKMINFRERVFEDLPEVPGDFLKKRKDPEEMEMNYLELRDYIERRREGGGDVKKEITDLYVWHIAYHFANLIVAFMGVPLSLSYSRGSAGMGFVICLVVAFIYYGVLSIARSMGLSGVIPPWAAAAIPNLSFLIVGLYFNVRAPK